MASETITLKDARQVKLGRIRPIEIIETDKFRVLVFPGGKVKAALKLERHWRADRDTTPPPASVDWAAKAMDSIKRVYLNDQYGDCVIAGKYHQVGVWSANDITQGPQQIVLGTDQEVLNSYHTICGPGDNGCVITDVLDYMKSPGLLLSGKPHKIDGYVAIDWTNRLMVQVCLEVFGGLTIGINLPGDWTCTNCTWDMTNSRIVGGHDICCVGYNDAGVQCATWGGLVTITWAAFMSKNWIEECYAELAPDWYGADNLAVNGIDVTTLKDDLAKLGGGVIPDPGPGPGPIPIPPGPTPVPPGPTPTPGFVTIPDQILSVPGMFGTHHNVVWKGGTYPVTYMPGLGAGAIPWAIIIAIFQQGLAFVCANPGLFGPALQPIITQICGFVPHAKAPCVGCK